MDFATYQQQSRKTAIYPDAGQTLVYPTLGLAGEAGEVAEKVKKIIRDNSGTVTEENRAEIAKELGDVLWYIAVTASYLDIDLDDLAVANINKLADRQARGVLSGSGDNR